MGINGGTCPESGDVIPTARKASARSARARASACWSRSRARVNDGPVGMTLSTVERFSSLQKEFTFSVAKIDAWPNMPSFHFCHKVVHRNCLHMSGNSCNRRRANGHMDMVRVHKRAATIGVESGLTRIVTAAECEWHNRNAIPEGEAYRGLQKTASRTVFFASCCAAVDCDDPLRCTIEGSGCHHGCHRIAKRPAAELLRREPVQSADAAFDYLCRIRDRRLVCISANARPTSSSLY